MSDSILNIDALKISAMTKRVPKIPEKIESVEKLRKVAQEFESMFMDIVLKAMRATVPESKLLDDSGKERFYQTWLDTEYSKIMSDKGPTGLSELIVKQLKSRMEGP